LAFWRQQCRDACVPSVTKGDRQRLLRERGRDGGGTSTEPQSDQGYGVWARNLQPSAETRDLIPRLSVTPTGYGESFPHHILAQIGRLKESLGAMLIAVENSPKSNG